MKSIQLTIGLILLIPLSALSQEVKKDKKQLPISIGLSAHFYSWPFVKSIGTPLQLGFSIGTEHVYKVTDHIEILQSFRVGFFHNQNFAQSIYLDTQTNFRHRFSNDLFIEGGIGIGYIHRFHSRQIFKLTEDGSYEASMDTGSPGAMIGFSLGAGHQFKTKHHQFDAFIKYDWFVDYPHVTGSIPIMANSLYHMGARFYLNLNK